MQDLKNVLRHLGDHLRHTYVFLGAQTFALIHLLQLHLDIFTLGDGRIDLQGRVTVGTLDTYPTGNLRIIPLGHLSTSTAKVANSKLADLALLVLLDEDITSETLFWNHVRIVRLFLIISVKHQVVVSRPVQTVWHTSPSLRNLVKRNHSISRLALLMILTEVGEITAEGASRSIIAHLLLNS
jgi:hypothetical protein